MKFTVPEMSCGHCTAAIEKALKQADPAAKVDCDLGTRQVTVESSLSQTDVAAAMQQAGYESQPAAA